jgi:hypothetical protein
VATSNADLRNVDCGYVSFPPVELAPGTHELKIEVIGHNVLTGFASFADDAVTINLTVL